MLKSYRVKCVTNRNKLWTVKHTLHILEHQMRLQAQHNREMCRETARDPKRLHKCAAKEPLLKLFTCPKAVLDPREIQTREMESPISKRTATVWDRSKPVGSSGTRQKSTKLRAELYRMCSGDRLGVDPEEPKHAAGSSWAERTWVVSFGNFLVLFSLSLFTPGWTWAVCYWMVCFCSSGLLTILYPESLDSQGDFRARLWE